MHIKKNAFAYHAGRRHAGAHKNKKPQILQEILTKDEEDQWLEYEEKEEEEGEEEETSDLLQKS